MAKKVIGINGSPRKKNSSEMLDFALRGAESAGAEVERFDLGKLNFSGCKSCFACKLKDGKNFGKCALRDEVEVVTTHETLQCDDYSKYVGDYKLALKEQIHKDQYPIDCQNAFDMGARLTK